MQWILDNKEWIFSSVGVAIAGLIMGWFFKRKKTPSGDSEQKLSLGYKGVALIVFLALAPLVLVLLGMIMGK